MIRNRDWNNDIVLYTRTLELSPDAYIILNNLGTVYWHEGDLDKAESTWQRVLALNPSHADVLNNLGMLASRRHRYAEALGFFQRAIEAKPSLAGATSQLGRDILPDGTDGGSRTPTSGGGRAFTAQHPRSQ